MDLAEIAREVALLDAMFAPIAKAPVDTSDPEWTTKLIASNALPVPERLGVADRSASVLDAILARYSTGDDLARTAIREIFDRYTSFRWAAQLPYPWHGPAEFRARLVHISACDQGADTRDEILALQGHCAQAREEGIDVGPILAEVAAMSSDVDRYGMGSMRRVILAYGGS